MENIEMKNAVAILDSYIGQIEAGQVSFESLMQRFNELIDSDPRGNEVAVLAAILGDLYPNQFAQALNAKFKAMVATLQPRQRTSAPRRRHRKGLK